MNSTQQAQHAPHPSIFVMTWNAHPGIRVVGPFANVDKASVYGREWSAFHDDNTCWRVIDGPVSVEVVPAP